LAATLRIPPAARAWCERHRLRDCLHVAMPWFVSNVCRVKTADGHKKYLTSLAYHGIIGFGCERFRGRDVQSD